MNTKGFPEINWSDDDDGFDDLHKREESGSSDFASMMENESIEDVFWSPGDRVRGTIVTEPRPDGSVAVDLGAQVAGMIEGRELFDENGETALFRVGDVVEAYVISKSPDGYLLSQDRSGALQSKHDIQRAFEEKIPVRGRVEKAVKGGFEVKVLGKMGFCPISKIDSSYVENTAEYIGKDFQFAITQWNNRNLVLDRASLLRQEMEEKLEEITSRDNQEQTYSGKVTRIEPFGAFVRLENNIEGLVHISEISHVRISHPSDVLHVGEQVRATIIDVKTDNRGQKKISLSIKQAGDDPWDSINEIVSVGHATKGRVRRLADFGVFVEIEGQFEGLVHISEMTNTKRIRHPSELVKEGDVVDVFVQSIDTKDRRISLSMKKLEVGEEAEGESEKVDFEEYMATKSTEKKRDANQRGSLGDILAASLEKKNKP